MSQSDAADRVSKYGENEIDVGGGVVWYKILIRQFFNAMIIVSISIPFVVA